MYSFNQDIVAGRSASQIEAAKRRAVGGSKKKCRRGKSCGAACINQGKVCLVDLPWVFSQGLTKVAREVQGSKVPPVDVDQVNKQINDSLQNIYLQRVSINYSKEQIDAGLENYKIPLKRAMGEIESEVKKARDLISSLPSGAEKDGFTRRLGLMTGEVKGLPKSSLKETNGAGKEFMDKYKSKLDSAFSIMRRVSLAERSVSDRLFDDPNLSFRERMRLKKALFRLGGYSARADERSLKIITEMRKELLNTKLSETDIRSIISRMKLTGDNIPSGSPLFGQVRSQIEEFARMFNGKGLIEEVRDGIPGQVLRETSISVGNRAFSRFSFISTDGNARTMFHEIAHIVEGGRPWLAQYAAQWRDKKAYTVRKATRDKGVTDLVKGTDGKLIPHSNQTLSGRDLPVFKLAEMPVHKNSGFGADEIALVDKFISPYMGKLYSGSFTEVISMAMERFSTPYEMKDLYKNHPDLFEVVVGLAVT